MPHMSTISDGEADHKLLLTEGGYSKVLVIFAFLITYPDLYNSIAENSKMTIQLQPPEDYKMGEPGN